MRKAAEFAEKLADAGYDAWSIVQELSQAADAEEFGWTGMAHFGTSTGVVPLSDCEELEYRIAELIEENDRAKTVSKDMLRAALNG
jgi:hypothetical protein